MGTTWPSRTTSKPTTANIRISIGISCRFSFSIAMNLLRCTEAPAAVTRFMPPPSSRHNHHHSHHHRRHPSHVSRADQPASAWPTSARSRNLCRPCCQELGRFWCPMASAIIVTRPPVHPAGVTLWRCRSPLMAPTISGACTAKATATIATSLKSRTFRCDSKTSLLSAAGGECATSWSRTAGTVPGSDLRRTSRARARLRSPGRNGFTGCRPCATLHPQKLVLAPAAAPVTKPAIRRGRPRSCKLARLVPTRVATNMAIPTPRLVHSFAPSRTSAWSPHFKIDTSICINTEIYARSTA
mmetsp:Transcript_27427/g.76922  ORF Transcript_27427/g.76922 Transcript_27427/m.76922 type:complete len:299 (-) Transcript_27427:264-1160(-)